VAWWPGEEGWHLGYGALTPPGLLGGTAVFDLTRGNLTAGLADVPDRALSDRYRAAGGVRRRLDTTLGRLDPTGVTILARHPGRWDGLTGSGWEIAVLCGGRYRPTDVHFGPIAGPLRRITDTRPELDGIVLGTQQPMAYRAADGLELDGLLVLPVASDGTFPLVTILHGGPYDRYADRCQLFWFPSAQWLAAAGYAVFLPNPRGGQGHGHEFAASVAGRVGLEEWTDITTGIDLLVARGERAVRSRSRWQHRLGGRWSASP
jgi:dipeptidyl aminopeptidase/acylaminoacyl peptidase